MVAVGVVLAGVAVAVAAGDHRAGDGSVAGQPPRGLGGHRPGPVALAARCAGLAEQAGQLDGDGDLRTDPAAVGQPAALQGAASQLDQRIRAPLRPAAVIVGGGGAGQGFQGGQQGLAGLGFQQPVDGHHPRQGR
jgi:hypothetical protein